MNHPWSRSPPIRLLRRNESFEFLAFAVSFVLELGMLDSFSFEVEEPCPTMGGESCRFDQFFLMRRCGQLGGIRSQAENVFVNSSTFFRRPSSAAAIRAALGGARPRDTGRRP